MTATKTARQLAREQMNDEIKECARRQLGVHGANGLSLRAITRELGMVSSAIYRYFASRDELLTALILDAFNEVGQRAEDADESVRQDIPMHRWLAVWRAIREWAVANPHEYALIHGTPVPGYAAPQATAEAAARDGIVLVGIVRDCYAADILSPMEGLPPVPESFVPDAERLRAALFADLPDDVVLRSLQAWTYLYGAVSFELFGMYNNVLTDIPAVFDNSARVMARMVGIPGS